MRSSEQILIDEKRKGRRTDGVKKRSKGDGKIGWKRGKMKENSF